MKNVIITGASRGIGFDTALLFIKKGFNIAACCKENINRLDPLKAAAAEYGVRAAVFACDVSDFRRAHNFIDLAVNEIGEPDILVNNAGISYIGLVQDMTEAEWNEVMATNAGGVFNCCHAVLPYMIKRKSGRIINIASIWGEVGASCEAAYSASKGAVISFSKALAKEVAPSGIAVNAVSPGVVDTDMNKCFTKEEMKEIEEEIPVGRGALASEVAAVIAMLAESPLYMTGTVIPVNGGMN